MNFIRKNSKGILLCLLIAVPSWFAGKAFPIIGGPVIAILAGMIITLFFREKGSFAPGIKFTSKKSAVGCNFIGIRTESQCDFRNRKTVSADYRLHHCDFPYHCLYTA